MTNKDEIEMARNILNNAANINISKELLLKISQKLDKYIIEYYRNGENKKEAQIVRVPFINTKKSGFDYEEIVMLLHGEEMGREKGIF